MTTRFLISLLAPLAIACGSKSAGDTAPPTGEDHHDHHHAATGGDEHDHHPAADANASPEALAAAETAAFEKARPVFEKHCSKCHSREGKNAKPKSLDHFDMTSYPFGGHHAAEIAAELRKVLAIGGGKAIMPMDNPGAVKGDELDLIAAWADAYDKAHEGGSHGHDGHGEGEHHHDGDHDH